MNMYYKSVGHNSTLIMGITPGPDGLIPEPDVISMKEWGDEIRKQFGNPVAQTNGRGNRIKLDLEKPSLISRIVIQEDIVKGERVRDFVVEGFFDGRWMQIADGFCIGHKRIQILEKPMTLEKIRLKITNSITEPLIKNISVYK